MSDIVFPLSLPGIKMDLQREPVHAVSVQTMSSGSELRASWQSYPRYKYDMTLEVARSDITYAEFQRLMSMFVGTLGPYDDFLIQDPDDSAVTDMGFGVTDGSSSAYQLQRTLGGVRQVGVWDPNTYPIYTTPRTNLYPASQTFIGTGYSSSLCTLGNNAAVAPDGTLTASTLNEGASAGVHSYMYALSGLTSGATYCWSCWLQQSTARYAQLVFDDGGTNGVVAHFDLQAGTVTTLQKGSAVLVEAGVVAYPNGWYRGYVAGHLASTAGRANFSMTTSSAASWYPSYTGTSKVLAIWGGQFELGSTPTQPIVTSGAASTSKPAYWPAYGDGFEPVVDVSLAGLGVSVGGVAQSYGTDFTVGQGVVNFSSIPAANQPLTWTGSYFRRVRFAQNNLPLRRIVQKLWEGQSIPLISLK